MKNKYQIRYQHTSWSSADSKDAAIREVKNVPRVSRLYFSEVPDGLYCYTSAADKARDISGERAYAVICGPNQQNLD
jgi:hypothetical protein